MKFALDWFGGVDGLVGLVVMLGVPMLVVSVF